MKRGIIMFCSKCGSNIEQGATFCSDCGAPVSQANTQQQYQQQQYQQQYQQQQYQQPYNNGFGQPYAQPMAWFKFLIYFALFAGAFGNIISGIVMLSGSHYENSKYVYRAFESLQTLDVIVGILSLVIAGYSIYVRVRLAGFYKNGPSSLATLYSLSVLVNLIYYIGITSILPDYIVRLSDLDLSASLSMIVSAVMIFVNKVYFDKRKHLFVRQ